MSKPAPKPRGKPGRPPKFSAEVQAEALRLAAETTPEEAAETMAARGTKVSSRQIRNWQDGRHVAADTRPAATPSPGPASTAAPPAPPGPPLPPPTEAERKVDELVAKSRTWRRVCAVLGDFARENPAVAPLLAAKLRSLNL